MANAGFKEGLSNIGKYYGLSRGENDNDEKCLGYAEKCRALSNLRRTTMFATLFVGFSLFLFGATTRLKTEFSSFLYLLYAIAAILLIFFIFVSTKLYNKGEYGEFGIDKRLKLKVQTTYTIFWTIYYIVTIALVLILKEYEFVGLAIWMPLMIMGFIVPVFNFQEGFIPMVFAGISAIVLVKQSFASLGEGRGLWIIIPAIAIVILLTDMNHIERVNAFYQEGKTRGDAAASKRQLGNVFEEIYDLAFELNLKNGECTTLRNNDQYLIKYGKPVISSERFVGFVMDMIHPDDAHIAERILNREYLENEFVNQGRSQIYNEVRLLTGEDTYVWTSVLFIKEKSGQKGYDNEGYILCLVQNIEDRKKNEDRLKLEAERDPLTQLYNKTTTRSLIEECLEKNPTSQHALLVIDIDNFKTINDTRGHAIGDQILLAFSNELSRNFRESDILGRAGGDEFIVLLKNIQSVALVCDKLQQLTSAFKKYGIDHGYLGRLSTSIGVAIFNKDGRTYDELFKKADAALYEAKRNGKDQYKFSITRS